MVVRESLIRGGVRGFLGERGSYLLIVLGLVSCTKAQKNRTADPGKSGARGRVSDRWTARRDGNGGRERRGVDVITRLLAAGWIGVRLRVFEWLRQGKVSFKRCSFLWVGVWVKSTMGLVQVQCGGSVSGVEGHREEEEPRLANEGKQGLDQVTRMAKAVRRSIEQQIEGTRSQELQSKEQAESSVRGWHGSRPRQGCRGPQIVLSTCSSCSGKALHPRKRGGGKGEPSASGLGCSGSGRV